ncbi:hypothetical protein NL676_000747 [Syzygium grande]|nr:hypothetical protein NL676_000747 [Syzygium grande]
MKFFSDLRACYRSGAGGDGDGDGDPCPMRREEARAPLSCGGGLDGRRRRSTGGGRRPTRGDAGAGQWRPALSAISEDSDVSAAAAAAAVRAAEAKSRGRGANAAVKRPPPPKGGSAAKRAQSFGDREDYRPNPLSMFMPAFSPTPFMI